MTIIEIKYYYMKLEEQEQKAGCNHQNQGGRGPGPLSGVGESGCLGDSPPDMLDM